MFTSAVHTLDVDSRFAGFSVWVLGYGLNINALFVFLGIIDPTKVVKTALSDASSVASLMATTEAAIVDAPEPRPANSEGMSGAGGGMPMGGMF